MRYLGLVRKVALDIDANAECRVSVTLEIVRLSPLSLACVFTSLISSVCVQLARSVKSVIRAKWREGVKALKYATEGACSLLSVSRCLSQ